MTFLKTRPVLIAIAFIFAFNCANSQTLVGTTGTTTLNGNGYSFEYAVGVISIATLSANGNTGYVTQGILQPNVKVNDPDCEVIMGVLHYFPNPAKNKVRIVGRNDWITHYIIYSADGRLMVKQPFVNNYIDLTRFANGLYLIQLLPGCNGEYNTLKILKN